MRRSLRHRVALLLFATAPAVAAAADLQSRTTVAFDRYVQAIETRMQKRSAFLWIDRAGEPDRRRANDALARGELLIDAIDRDDTGVDRSVPDGLVHHWI